MYQRLILLFIALALIAGCGFQLRGTAALSQAFTTVFIDGGNDSFVEQLTKALKSNGGEVAESGDGVPTIIINQSDFTRDAATTDNAGVATEYSYQYTVDYEIKDAAGESLLESTKINQFRNLEYEPGNELEAERDEEFLREEMEQEIALQIIRRLGRL